ncbi:hypothetical protein FHS49_000985 [Sphingobium boeckii]|uniref:Uncharacterized protein n=1 Tax=Sphingobium boeckii TaxID=1082345 RepID=A0A7W9EDJ5_9SPHN|nr:hypothetical protein [Sphingobium boeckii]
MEQMIVKYLNGISLYYTTDDLTNRGVHYEIPERPVFAPQEGNRSHRAVRRASLSICLRIGDHILRAGFQRFDPLCIEHLAQANNAVLTIGCYVFGGDRIKGILVQNQTPEIKES